MSMMECAHCGQAGEARSLAPCSDCGAMICEGCARTGGCPDGDQAMAEETVQAGH